MTPYTVDILTKIYTMSAIASFITGIAFVVCLIVFVTSATEENPGKDYDIAKRGIIISLVLFIVSLACVIFIPSPETLKEMVENKPKVVIIEKEFKPRITETKNDDKNVHGW